MSGINIIRRWVMGQMTKKSDDGIMITLPDSKKVDLNTNITADKLLRNGIDIDQLTSVAQVENLINRINKLSTRVISQDDPRFKGIMDKMMGKRGEVVDMEGKKIPQGSRIMGGQAVDEDLPPPGSRGGPDDIAAPVQSAEETIKNMAKAEVDTLIKNLKRLDPIETMKEANKIIKREDYYKNLSDADAKRILEETEDHIFQRNIDLDPEDFAKGGIARIGYKDGPKFDIQAEGSKSGKQQIAGAPKGITMDSETFNAIINADIPISQKIDLLGKFQYGKGRTRIEKDGQELFLGEGGSKSRDIGLGFNKDGEGFGGTLMYNMETGKPEIKLRLLKRFAEGGRIGLKDGMNRRTFLKLLGGAISIPIIGKFFKPLKGVGKVSKAPMIKTPDIKGKPEWFDSLVNRVIMEGDDVTKKLATKDREVVHTKKLNDTDEVTVYQDLETDSIRVEYKSPDNMLEEPVDLMYKKTPPDETVPKGSAEFEASEMGFVSRQDGPDDYFIDAEPTGGSTIKDLDSDVSVLKEYATGKGPTMKEFVQKKKRKDKVKRINEGDLDERSQYIVDRQGDYVDYDDYARGGLAGMLGE